MPKPYQAPTIRTVGSVGALTEETFNKVGPNADSFTTITGGVVVGSLVPSP